TDGATTVFRIFQEILTNVARHAQATQVEVILEESAAVLTLQVQDNGRGITESEIHSPKSIGLLGMRERARLCAGEIQFQGMPGKGTTVIVRLPLSMNN
ncbi:sensor histidine kinase, partial [Chloroflexota bacterium]